MGIDMEEELVEKKDEEKEEKEEKKREEEGNVIEKKVTIRVDKYSEWITFKGFFKSLSAISNNCVRVSVTMCSLLTRRTK